MNGTPVATIVDRTLAAGSYSIPFSEEIEPGAYLLSMRTNSGRLTTLVNVVR
jgi:hypothetical protein